MYACVRCSVDRTVVVAVTTTNQPIQLETTVTDTEIAAVPDEAETALATLPDDFDDGLEDFETSDMVMPRVNLVHADQEFEDNLSGERFSELEVVILGLVKQRVMWAEEVDEGDGPLCRSNDAKIGSPQENFPWDASGFAEGTEEPPCEQCNFSQWQNNKPPACNEQYTLPVLMPIEGQGFIAPAILTFQRSGLKTTRSYLSSFKRSGTPTFTATTTISLEAKKRGSVVYSTPKFQKGEPTDADNYQMFAQQYRSIREYLHSVGAVFDDEDDTGTTDADNTSEASDEDLPF